MNNMDIDIDPKLVEEMEKVILLAVAKENAKPDCKDQDIVKLIRKIVEERVKCKYRVQNYLILDNSNIVK